MKYRYRIEDITEEYLLDVIDEQGGHIVHTIRSYADDGGCAVSILWETSRLEGSFSWIVDTRLDASLIRRGEANRVVTDWPSMITSTDLLTKYGHFGMEDGRIRAFEDKGCVGSIVRNMKVRNHYGELFRKAAAQGLLMWVTPDGFLEWEGRHDGYLWDEFDRECQPLPVEQYRQRMIDSGRVPVKTYTFL